MDEKEFEQALSRLPEHLRDGVREYVLRGRGVGSFLTAVIKNQFFDAVVHADDTIDKEHLVVIAKVFYNDTPRLCWGSPEQMRTWQAHGGWEGRDK